MLANRRKICLLGSTGSVGSNTLELIRQRPQAFEVVGLACGSSVQVLANQVEEFRPRFVSLATEEAAKAFRKLVSNASLIPEVFIGPEGHAELVRKSKPDVLIGAMLGIYGLQASLAAIEEQVPVFGIANKEILVMAGDLIMNRLQGSKTQLVPVDSEHSAIFQSLRSGSLQEVKKVLLTGSGGPFREFSKDAMNKATKAQALKHPNWKMGQKITIDSATMMNKGLEFIEAMRLFRLPKDKIEIVIHPESVVHSLVEFCDHSVIAQMGVSDMKIPISYALYFPDRMSFDLTSSFDLATIGRLHFEEPDFEKFDCLRLALESVDLGPQGPIILNAANEEAVAAFLEEKIGFGEIPRIIDSALKAFSTEEASDLGAIISLNAKVGAWCRELISTPSSSAKNL